MTVRWVFDEGGTNEYAFPRNPDRYGGDTYWRYPLRFSELEILGSSLPTIHVDGFSGARRTLRFTAITGAMLRKLEGFYLRKLVVPNCRDHLYDITSSNSTHKFSCYIESFTPMLHPTTGSFPGSGEDTWDLELTLIRTS